MTNWDVNWTVNRVGYVAVVRDVYEVVPVPVNWPGNGIVPRAVDVAVNHVVHLAMCRAIEEREAPPHPGLEPYLAEVA